MALKPEFRALSEDAAGYQRRLERWCTHTFGEGSNFHVSPLERALRFGEESIELLQACDVTKEQVLQLVEYVYNRPKGEAPQEVGGVMTTLGLLCIKTGINFGLEGEREYNRINTPELIEKIRNKQVSKNLHGIGGTPEAAKLNG